MEEILALRESRLSPEHPAISYTLNCLALVYRDMNRLKEAIPLMERSLAIDEAVHGKDHAGTGAAIHNLALVYKADNRFEAAEPLMKRAISIIEKPLARMTRISQPLSTTSPNSTWIPTA